MLRKTKTKKPSYR